MDLALQAPLQRSVRKTRYISYVTQIVVLCKDRLTSEKIFSIFKAHVRNFTKSRTFPFESFDGMTESILRFSGTTRHLLDSSSQKRNMLSLLSNCLYREIKSQWLQMAITPFENIIAAKDSSLVPYFIRRYLLVKFGTI